jgi:tetratricopeptide (TPR) repeat protein
VQELLGIVDASSQHVPLHMQALMHQNMGALEHSLATAAGTQTADRSTHLRSAQEHLQRSVAAFNRRLQSVVGDAALEQDSSALMEASYSLQLLAGVICELGQYSEGLQQWQQAVRHARISLLGLELGVRYSNLAAALYNAAVCHASAGSVAEAISLAHEARSTAQRGLAQGGDRARHAALIAAADALLRGVSFGQPPSAERLPRTKDVGLAEGSVRSATLAGGDTYIVHDQEGQEEEWVECELGDDSCELVEVAGAAEAQQAQPEVASGSKVGTGTGAAVEDVLAGLDLEGMSADEVEELRETRERYFRQTQRIVRDTTSSSGQGVEQSGTAGTGPAKGGSSTGATSTDRAAQREVVQALEKKHAELMAKQEDLAKEIVKLGIQIAELRRTVI